VKVAVSAGLALALAMAAGGAWAQATVQPPPPSPQPTPTPPFPPGDLAPSTRPVAPAPSPSAPAAAAPPAAAPPAAAPPPPAPPAAPPETVCDPLSGDVCLTAQKQERLEKGHFRLTGFVDLRFGDSRIQCEQLDMFETEKPDGTTSRRIEAQGNVVFLRGDERLAGSRMEMDLGSGQGTFYDVLGFVQPGVFIEAREIERVDADTFKIRGGKFTSCAQPTPRWSFSASSATLDVDDKIVARNVVFKVKQVPAIYIPIFAYPIQEDQRSSGFLFPHFGTSSARGFTVGGGFFWAMGRSYDQTFYFDNYSDTGYGLGHEFRYALKSPSRGGFKSYFFNDQETGWEYDLHWNALQMLPAKVRATVQVDRTSDRVFQQTFNDRLDLATNRTQYATLSLQRSFGITTLVAVGESRDTFFGDEGDFDRRRRLPGLLITQSPRKFRGTGLVFSYAARGERLGLTNENVLDSYSRYDVLPRLSRPFSLSFLQFTPEVAARYTSYSTRDAAPDGPEVDLTGEPLQRRYFESSVDMRGPTFSRVFDTPGNFYSDRYKHVIGPEVQWTYRTRIDDFNAIPRFDGHDQITGTNQVRYSLVQRLYAKRPGASGKPEPYEFLSWRLSQTYYVQIGASSFDPNYSSAFFDETGAPSHWSPVQSSLVFRPSLAFSSNFDFEYDINFNLFRRLTLSTNLAYPRVLFQATYSRSKRAALNPENRVLSYHTIRGGSRVVLWPNKLAVDGSADYDILQKELIQTTARLRYDVQCCGFQFEMVNSRYRDPPDRQFRFSIELANIGSMGNFMGGPEERR
jgi:LPS-assembly protein